MKPIGFLLRKSTQPELARSSPVKNGTATEFEIDGWAISDFVLRKLVPVVGYHPFPLHELMLMTGAVCTIKPTEIYEWGTHIGKSARVFYEITSHYGIATTIHSTDLPDTAEHIEHPHDERGRLVRGLAGVELHQGDGLDTSLGLWRAGGAARPLFFVDGDHSFESVTRELTGIADAVPDAAILVHDSFYQSPESGYNIGPRLAIEQLLAAKPDRFKVVHSGLSLPGMTLFYPVRPGE